MITTGLGSTSAGLTVTAVRDGGTTSDLALCCLFVASASNKDFVFFFVMTAMLVGV